MEEVKNNSNTLKAVLLSLLVAILGAVFWGVLYAEGWFVSIVAYVTAFLMLKVYKKNKPNYGKGVYVYVFVIIVLLNTIASFMAIVVNDVQLLNLEFSYALKIEIEYFYIYADAFIEDALLGAIFAVLGIVSVVAYDKKMANQKANSPVETNDNKETTLSQNSDTEKADEEETKKVSKNRKQKFCTHCGARLDENDAKCPSCGAKVEE